MFGPSRLGAYTRISLRSSNTYVYLWKSRGGQAALGSRHYLLLLGDIEGAKIWDSSLKEKHLSLNMVETGKGKNAGVSHKSFA